MRVVHVTPYYAPEVEFGGPPATVHELCRALNRAGVAVHVVTTADEAREDKVDGVPVTRVRRRTRLGFAAAMDDVLDAQLRRADACHIHTLFNWTAWRADAIARRHHRPTIVSSRGMLEPPALAHHELRKKLAWQLLDRRVVTNAAAVVASSVAEAASLRAGGVASLVVPNGVDAPGAPLSRGRFRVARGIAPEAHVITFLGRIHPIKRLDLLADAFVHLAPRNARAVLVIAGPDEAGLSNDLRTRLAPVGGRVHWVGPVGLEDKWQILADSDALVLCSDSESYGRVVAEGLAAGVPAVVTRTCPWQVLETEALGRWVPQSGPAIANALEELLSDPAAHRAMSARARDYALTEFGWDRAVAQYVALYESTLTSARAPAMPAQAGFHLR